MAYSKLNLKNGQKLTATHLAHIESGIAANETELTKKAAKSDIPDVSNLQPKGDYALKNEIPDASNFATHGEVQDLIDAIDAVDEVKADKSELKNYQPKGNYLTEYQKLKTINGQSLIGEGDIKTQVYNRYAGLAGKKISFLGDSITTFEGYIPEGYQTFYPNYDITDVEHTWWYQLISTSGMELLSNASWSGSTLTGVSNQAAAYPGCSSERVADLAKDGVTPDIIVVMMGINDFNRGKVVGSWSGGNIPAEGTIETFSEAYALLMHKIQSAYPYAEIFICTLPETADGGYDDKTLKEWNDCIRMVAECFGVSVLDMHACGMNSYNRSRFYGDSVHPKAEGAKFMARRALSDICAKSIHMHPLVPSDYNEDIEVPVTSISVSGSSTREVTVGSNISLAVIYAPSNTTQKGVTWSSSDSTKAEVSAAGVVNGVSEGEVTITATSKHNPSLTASWTIAVNAAKDDGNGDVGNEGGGEQTGTTWYINEGHVYGTQSPTGGAPSLYGFRYEPTKEAQFQNKPINTIGLVAIAGGTLSLYKQLADSSVELIETLTVPTSSDLMTVAEVKLSSDVTIGADEHLVFGSPNDTTVWRFATSSLVPDGKFYHSVPSNATEYEGSVGISVGYTVE